VRLWLALGVLVAILVVVAASLAGGDDPVTATPSPTPSPTGAAEVTIEDPTTGGHVPEGEPIPDWSAPALGGGTITWSELPPSPTVLAIWAPWCPHCQAELPRLTTAVAAHPGVSLVTIATAVDLAAGPSPEEYMNGAGLSFPVALDDAQGTLAVGLGVRGFPTTYFVDANGRVVASAEGELDPDAVDEVLTFLESA
jgi:thiol-disulfide isomerase/thioredoxin